MDDGTKFILNLSGDLNDGFKEIIEKTKYEIIEEVQEERLSFIIMGENYQVKDLNEKYKTLEKNIYVISLNKISDKEQFYQYNGRGIIDIDLLDTAIYKNILERFLTQNSSLQLEETFLDLFKEYNSVRISDHITIGHYTDLITAEAFNKDFNPITVRNYLVDIISYLAYLKKSEIAHYPFEISYGINKDHFILQIVASVENFVIEYVQDGMQEKSSINPSNVLLKRAMDQTSFMETFHLKKSSKICITSIWSNRSVEKEYTGFQTILMTEVDSFSHQNKLWHQLKTTPKIVLENKSIFKSLKSKELPGSGPEFREYFPLEKEIPSGYERVISFAVSKLGEESDILKTGILSVDDLDHLIKEYPNQELISRFSHLEKQAIVDLINEPIKLEAYKEARDDAVSTIGGDQDFMNGVVTKISDLKLEDLHEIVRVKGKVDVEDGVVCVAGGKESGDPDYSRIIGQDGEDLSEDLTKIKDIFQEITSNEFGEVEVGAWDNVRDKMVSTIKNGFSILKEENEKLNLGTIKQVVVDSIETDLKMVSPERMEVANSIINDVITENFKSLIPGDSLQSISEKVSKLNEEINLRDEQIRRMKKLIDAMKDKMKSTQTLHPELENTLEESEGGRNNKSSRYYAGEINNLKKVISDKDELIVRLKKGDTMAQMKRDQYVSKLEDEIKSLKSKGGALGNIAGARGERGDAVGDISGSTGDQTSKIMELEEKNIFKENEVKKLEYKVEGLKSQNDANLKIVEDFKRVASEFSQKLKQTEAELYVVKQEQSKNLKKISFAEKLKSSVAEKDIMLGKLNLEVKNLTDQNKDLSAKYRILDEKLKNLDGGAGGNQMMSQVEKNRKASGQAQTVSKLNHKLKQLEMLNEKLAQTQKKSNSSIATAKQEAHKLKQENRTLKNQISDLERKVTSKKAS